MNFHTLVRQSAERSTFFFIQFRQQRRKNHSNKFTDWKSLKKAIKSNFLHFSSFFITESDGLQRFSEQPRYTEVNPGQDALLNCKIIDRRGTCSWQKDNKPVGMYAKKYEWSTGNANPMSSMQQNSNSGDCSIWIRAATLEFDDGFWECQVTASDFTAQDALTSQPVRLVVRGKNVLYSILLQVTRVKSTICHSRFV